MFLCSQPGLELMLLKHPIRMMVIYVFNNIGFSAYLYYLILVAIGSIFKSNHISFFLPSPRVTKERMISYSIS